MEQSLYNIYLKLCGFEVHGVLGGPFNSVLGGPGVVPLYFSIHISPAMQEITIYYTEILKRVKYEKKFKV